MLQDLILPLSSRRTENCCFLSGITICSYPTLAVSPARGFVTWRELLVRADTGKGEVPVSLAFRGHYLRNLLLLHVLLLEPNFIVKMQFEWIFAFTLLLATGLLGQISSSIPALAAGCAALLGSPPLDPAACREQLVLRVRTQAHEKCAAAATDLE